MSVESYPQFKVIQTDTAAEFQDEINQSIKELKGKHPQFKLIEGMGFSAIISYTESEEVIETVADEFHAEGIYYLCKHCPYLDDPHDKRIKKCSCRYAKNGVTWKDMEACNVFYKALKRGDVKPLPDYAR